MKDYIYMDEDKLNSTLAQLDQGLLTSFSEGQEKNGTTKNSAGENTSEGLEGILQFGARYVREFSNNNSTELTESQSKVIDYALNDYSIDYLLSKISDYTTFTTSIDEAEEGQIINLTSHFSIYDFDLIAEITSPDNVNLIIKNSDTEKIKKLEKDLESWQAKNKKTPEKQNKVKSLKKEIKELKQTNQESLANINMVNNAALFANKILAGSVFIKTDRSVALCKRECFRINNGQLAMLTESGRKINVLGLVSGTKKETHPDGEMDEFQTQDLNKIPSMFNDIFFSNFNLLNEDDRIITPIAIFFE